MNLTNVLYITHLINPLLMIAMPLVLGAFLARRFKLGWGLFWIGAAGFILSQVGHIPFNWAVSQLFNRGVLPVPPPEWNNLFYAIFLGLSAGLWEELTRFSIFRWWAKEARSWGKGLMLGAGWGGIEAIILGGLVLYTYLQMVSLRGADLSQVVPANQLALAQQQIDAYWSLPWYNTFLSAVERAFTIPLHLSCSILVLQTFIRKQSRWVWLAVFWHALVDAIIVYAPRVWAPAPWTTYAVEGLLGISAIMSLAIIFFLRTPEPAAELEEVAVLAPVKTSRDLTPILENLDNLDRTRYN